MGNTLILAAYRRFLFRVFQLLLVSAALFLGTLPASAQAVSEALARCALIADSTERLACFDRVAAGRDSSHADRIGTPAQGPDSVAVEDSETVVTTEFAGAAFGESESAAPDRSVAVSADGGGNSTSASSAGATPVDSASPATEWSTVGCDDVSKMPANPAPAPGPAETASSRQPVPAKGLGSRDDGNIAVVPPEPDELLASVERIAQQPRGEHIVFLDNDQVWVEELRNSYFPVEIGDSVTIKKRRFGGFLLVTESGKTYRVKRLR